MVVWPVFISTITKTVVYGSIPLGERQVKQLGSIEEFHDNLGEQEKYIDFNRCHATSPVCYAHKEIKKKCIESLLQLIANLHMSCQEQNH